jgi:CarD family transcriptional regulator
MPAAASKTGQKVSASPCSPAAAASTAAAAAAAAAQRCSATRARNRSANATGSRPAVVHLVSAWVGRITAIEEQEIAGISLELFVITFEKDKMTLRVPTGKSASVGMRKLAEDGIVKKAMETLKGKARIKRTMWSRRAQEYEAKINSGDLISIAEVVRDLYRSESQPEQSYSERQLYEAALDRMAREIAAVEKLDERGAVQRITEVLSKSAKGRRAAAEEGGGAEVKAA